MNKKLIIIAGLLFAVFAFANEAPPAKPDLPEVIAAQTAQKKAEAELVQAQAIIKTQQESLAIAQVVAERNQFGWQLALNQVEQFKAALADLQAKLADVQTKYELEKKQVEALLKNPGATGVKATTPATPPAK